MGAEERDGDRRSRPRGLGLWVALAGFDAGLITAVWSIVLLDGWRLVGDDAFIMLRAHDVIGANSPLTGMPSSFSSWSAGADPFHPGPTPFWLLAPATWVLGVTERAAVATTWLVVVGCAALNIRIAQRLAGRPGAIRALVLTVALQGALAPMPVWSPLTPILAAVELLTLCFLTWAIVAGHLRWWPLWIAVATLVVHADLSFAVTVGALGALAAITTARRISDLRTSSAVAILRRPAAWGSVAVLFAGWAPVVIDAVGRKDGGNLGEMWRAATSGVQTAGFGRVIHAIGHALSGRWYAFFSKGSFHIVALVLLILLVGHSQLTWSNRTSRHRVPGVVASVSLLASAASQAATPSAAGSQLLYLLPVTVTACFAWFALTADIHRVLAARAVGSILIYIMFPWAGVALVLITAVSCSRDWYRSRDRVAVTGVARRWFAVFIVGAFLLDSSLEIVQTGVKVETTYLGWTFGAVEPVTRQVVRHLPPGRYRWYPLDRPDGASFGAGVAVGILDQGFDLRVQDPLAKYYGTHRRLDGSELGTVYLAFGHHRPTAGSELVARYALTPRNKAQDAASQRAAATSIRATTVRFPIRSSDHFVGSVIAAFGGAGTPRSWNDTSVNEVGHRYWSNPSLIKRLPDKTIAALLDEGLIEEPPGWNAPLDGLGTQAVVSVWFDAGH